MPFCWFCNALPHICFLQKTMTIWSAEIYQRDNFDCLTLKCHWMAFLFVLRFYGPVNPMGSCRARSVYLATRLLGRLCPLSS